MKLFSMKNDKNQLQSKSSYPTETANFKRNFKKKFLTFKYFVMQRSL